MLSVSCRHLCFRSSLEYGWYMILSLRKLDFCFLGRFQLEMQSWLGARFWVSCPSMLRFFCGLNLWRSWASCHSFCELLGFSLVVSRRHLWHCFLGIIITPLAVTIFLHWLLYRSPGLEVRGLKGIPFKTNCSKVSLSMSCPVADLSVNFHLLQEFSLMKAERSDLNSRNESFILGFDSYVLWSSKHN